MTVRLTPDINDSPGPTETVLQNALIAGVAPYQSRVAFGAQTGSAWARTTWTTSTFNLPVTPLPLRVCRCCSCPRRSLDGGPGITLADFSDWPLVSNTLALAFSFSPSNLFNDVSLYWNGALATNISLPASALDLDAGAFSHARLELDGTNGGACASVTLIPDSLGTPGQPITVLSNSFIPGPALGPSCLEFASHNGGLLAKVDLDNVMATFEVLAPILLNPGECIVVVHNRAAFISRYGTGIRIAGEFSGSLENAGDDLTLLGPMGEPILDFSYDPSWYPITDGGGFSLVAVDPTARPDAWGQAQNWRPSTASGGSPGSADPPPPPAVLSATLSSGNALRLAWPASSGSFNLYSAASPKAPVGWTLVTDSPVLAGGRWVVTLAGYGSRCLLPLTRPAGRVPLDKPSVLTNGSRRQATAQSGWPGTHNLTGQQSPGRGRHVHSKTLTVPKQPLCEHRLFFLRGMIRTINKSNSRRVSTKWTSWSETVARNGGAGKCRLSAKLVLP